MSTFTGTGTLLRLAIRRDRIKLPAWILVIGAFVWLEVHALAAVYPGPKEQAGYATTMASSAAARMFGAIDGANLGSITMVELFVFVGIVIALVSSMLVVRHTRQNEETGRLELVCSGTVGRRAPLAAALLLALGVDLAFSIVCFTGLVAAGRLSTSGSLLMSLGWGGLGVAFAGVAAITSQLSSSARLANGLAGMMLAVAFVIQAVGSIGGTITDNGTAVDVTWVSWLSPFGWGQLAYPFGEQRWWALLPAVVAAVGSAGLAFVLSSRRDFGSGMLPELRANPVAAPWLAGPFGLALRLHRTTIIAWTAGFLAMGAFGGVFANSVEGMLKDNPTAREFFNNLGGTNVLIDSYMSVMVVYIALMAVGFALQVTLRLRGEEHGAGELVIVAGASRPRWLASHLTVAVVSTVIVLALTGLVMGLTGRASGASVDVGGLVLGTLAQAPAVFVYVGVAVLGHGLSPRWSGWLGWGLLGLSTALVFAQALDVPQWVTDLSPLSHAPMAPVDPVTAGPLLVLGAIALVLVVAGFVAFERRDFEPGA